MVIAVLGILSIFSCGNNTSSTLEQAEVLDTTSQALNTSSNDSIAIVKAFNTSKNNKDFIRSLGYFDEPQLEFTDTIIKILRGDLDGDGSEDALVLFSIEGGDLGNHWQTHYAAFLNHDNQWKFISQLSAGNDFSPRYVNVEKIKNGKITGYLEDNKEVGLSKIPVEYILKNGEIINTFTALHKEDEDEREFLAIDEILTAENISIPILATLKQYQTLLGKGKIVEPEEQPECGTYFYGYISYLEYPDFKFEFVTEKEAAWVNVKMPNNGIRVQTDKGTIDEKTTLEELKSIFYKTDSWFTTEMEDETEVFVIPDGMESDNQLHILFDKNGKLLSVSLFVMC